MEQCSCCILLKTTFFFRELDKILRLSLFQCGLYGLFDTFTMKKEVMGLKLKIG